MLIWGPKIVPKMSPKWAQNRLGALLGSLGPILGPKLAQEPQDSPKTAPRWPNMAPRRPKDGPRWPKMAPRRPKTAQDGPRWPKDSIASSVCLAVRDERETRSRFSERAPLETSFCSESDKGSPEPFKKAGSVSLYWYVYLLNAIHVHVVC
jgi:hypothetical protein